MLRSAASFALLAAVAWLGYSHRTADGLGTFEALSVGGAAFVALTLAAFARG